ncbi:MAG TPA: TetR/AcrR family transcriptional regulator [Streptosporangiaceae bacterium]|jgi:AcrR family transcriptional regulator
MDEVIWARPERGTRGPKPAHSRADLAAAGVRVADAEGLDAVTMRRVAAELGTGTTSLYRYVPSKEDLLDLMADAVLAEDDPPGRTGDWRADLAIVAHCMRGRMLRHPWLAALSALRPSLGPNGLRWLEFTLAAVDGRGLTADDMIIATGTVTTFVLGSVVTELAERRTASSLAQWRAAQGAYGDSIIAGGQYPVLARIMIEASLPHRDSPAEKGFTEGLSRILDGLAPLLDHP